MSTTNAALTSRGRIPYYSVIATIAALATLLVTLFPPVGVGLSLVGAAILVAIVDRSFRVPQGPSHLRSVPVMYAVFVAVVLLGALVLAWSFGRDGAAPWLGWVLAAAVFIVVLSGTWVAKASGRTTRGEIVRPEV